MLPGSKKHREPYDAPQPRTVLCQHGHPIPRGGVIVDVSPQNEYSMSDVTYSEFHGIRALNATDALGIAASASRLKELRLLLDDGVDINAIAIYSKCTALCSAARLGLTQSVALLIESGADVNRPSEGGTTPLMFASSLGKKKGLLIAKQLIAAGADVHYANSGESTASNALLNRAILRSSNC